MGYSTHSLVEPSTHTLVGYSTHSNDSDISEDTQSQQHSTHSSGSDATEHLLNAQQHSTHPSASDVTETNKQTQQASAPTQQVSIARLAAMASAAGECVMFLCVYAFVSN